VFRQGAQGAYDGASNGILESEFGTSVDDEVIKLILEKGTLQESQVCLFLVSLLAGPSSLPTARWFVGSPSIAPATWTLGLTGIL
jgi:hypothetical protein